MEATPRIELGMEVLQTSALPLGYVAAPFVTRFYRRRRQPPTPAHYASGRIGTGRLPRRHGPARRERGRDQRPVW